MTAAETADFEAYLADRRRRDPRGPLFGVERPDGRVAPFSRVALGAICAEALRRASGLATVSSHSLGRAALTSAFLAIHEARAGSGAGARVLRRLTGWDRATRARVAETLAPATLCRDGWTALAPTGRIGTPWCAEHGAAPLGERDARRQASPRRWSASPSSAAPPSTVAIPSFRRNTA